MKKTVLLILLIPFLFFAQTKRAISVEDLWSMKRIGTYDLSPDQKLIAFSNTSYNMDANKGNSDIYIINTDGTNLRPFRNSAENESDPKFSPDGKLIAFIKGSQIWTADLTGSAEEKVTNLSTEITGYEWSPDGSSLLFVSSVYPDCQTDDCNKKKDEALKESKVKAKLYTELMYRHWNDWRDDKRGHLFIMDMDDKKLIDITSGSHADVPPIALGSTNDYNFSPEGDEIAYTTNTDKMLSTSTNNEIYLLKIKDLKEGSDPTPVKISESKGNDNQPVYSPDGKYIAFTSMERAGFEADKQDLILYDRKSGSLKNITVKFDRSVGEFAWSKESDVIFFVAADEIYNSLFKINISTEVVTPVIKEAYISDLNIKGDKIYFENQSTVLPTELFIANSDGGAIRQITNLNSDILSGIEMNPVETFWSEGAEGAKIQSILIRPPFFDKTKRYPMIFLIHGGPQGHWSDDFHYRWNMQMFAAKGYVVVAPNPRGSIGYGQKFTDEISGDWGGKPYIDLMNAYDYATESFSYIDSTNTFAAGASYGGYMINWLAGHTDRFNALVSHAGVFNIESMYGTTEELWFPEWEFKGTPWDNREVYEKWSPHRYIHNAKTPVFIIHGAFDFRVPEEQAFQLFTSLQRLGVESQFLYFPDEYHFITKPQNARLWWNSIYSWFEKHLTEVK